MKLLIKLQWAKVLVQLPRDIKLDDPQDTSLSLKDGSSKLLWGESPGTLPPGSRRDKGL